ncbi:MAG TPA: LUD domain-containing protein [Paracoccaceae bacterium]|nr:LUD domain-containing protein [Paracoccaceae bacterium]
MSARERILGRLRGQLGAGEDRAARVAARLDGGVQEAPRPAFAATEGRARLDQFEAKVRAVDATVSRLDAVSELPAALAEELRRRNLPAVVRHGAEPMFRGLDWGTVEASEGTGRIEEPVTLSRAAFGLAETGTLVLCSGAENPVTLTFLGETHFVVLREADVVAGFEELWAAYRAQGLDPRTVNLVTGPSRSADIGQKLQLGAHGPVALHVFLVGEVARS